MIANSDSNLYELFSRKCNSTPKAVEEAIKSLLEKGYLGRSIGKYPAGKDQVMLQLTEFGEERFCRKRHYGSGRQRKAEPGWTNPAQRISELDKKPVTTGPKNPRHS